MMKLNKKLILLIAAIMLMLVLASCAAPTTGILPSDGTYCLDKTGTISSETKDYIRERNYNLEKNCDGAQICVAVINSTGTEDIMDYSYAVFSDWSIGSSKKNNGVLLLLAVRDNKYWVTTGYGLEDTFTYDVLKEVLDRNCAPYFDRQDYDGAVKNTVARINELLCAQYNADPAGYSYGSSFVGGGGQAVASAGSSGSSCTGFRPAQSPVISADACSACSSCSSCILACSCNSCTGIGAIILILVIVYVVLQVLRGMGKGVTRAAETRSEPSYTGRAYEGASRSGGFRPRAWMFALPLMMKATRASRVHRAGFTGTPFGSAFRGPRPGSGFSGFRGPTHGSGSFRGFTGGGGHTRGGGAGRR